MKHLALRALVILLAALAFAAVPLVTDSANADTFKYSSTNADASFFSVDGAGVETSVYVYASDFTDAYHDPPGRGGYSYSGSSAYVDIYQCDPGDPLDPFDDVCTRFYGWIDLDPEDFEVDGDLTSATLNAVVEVCSWDFPSDCLELTVDLTWSGVGELSTSRGNNHFRSPGFRENSRFSEASRSADVTGGIADDGTDFTGGQTGFGSLSSYESRGTRVD